MKGIVFTEFFKHIENAHGADLLDDVIVSAALPNDGGYTSVGTYPFNEMLSLVGACTKATGRTVADVLDGFGQHCLAAWVNYVPAFFGATRTLFDILAEINEFHELEVRKLYSDAELPTFVVETRDERVMVIGYYSPKQLTDLAIGVIKGAAAHLGQKIEVSAEPAEGPQGAYSRLRIEILSTCPPQSSGASCPTLTPI